jgi:hypothetical protein
VQAGARRLADLLPPGSDVSRSLLFLSTSAARLERGEGAGTAPAAEAWRQRGAAVADSQSAPSSEAAALWPAPGSLRGSRAELGGEGEWGNEEFEEEELMAMGAVRPLVGQVGRLGFGWAGWWRTPSMSLVCCLRGWGCP